MTMWYAHSLEDTDKSRWQPLSVHLRSVAELSAKRAGKFGAENAAALAGVLHDLGKYTVEFQRRLEGGRSVDHASAGAREVFRLARSSHDRLIAEILAHAIAGHHAGLPDSFGAASLDERRKGKSPALNPVWREEIDPIAEGIMPEYLARPSRLDRRAYQHAFFGRMIFSCLVDADFRDTESFYKGDQTSREWKALSSIIDELLARFDAHMTKLRAGAKLTSVNAIREHILVHARERAAAERGLFTLTVPTGGGKTLASLAFALEHAKRHGFERIVYAIPFTSIIDQTASIFRDVLRDPGGELILEHHSSIEEERIDDEDRRHRREAQEKLKLAMEDWAAPIVVTTNVQLFESLHAHRPSRCRRLHNLVNSVIILDEAQTIPLHVLRPCLAVLDELARNYGSSIVLCTATQPAVDEKRFVGGLALSPERELAPSPSELYEKLRRIRLAQLGALDDEALVAQLESASQGLMIVNSRSHALALYRRAREAGLDGVLHLTTRQYAAHRRAILADVRHRLAKGAPCRLVATSLVEAGVDLDFPRVWRAEAGLDQIAQAAGRCNREGHRSLEESVVAVFRSTDHPPPPEIAQFAAAVERLEERLKRDLLSREALEAYFQEVYWVKGAKLLDEYGVLDSWLLALHPSGAHRTPNFSYRTVGEKFRLIKSAMLPVIVDIEDAASEIVRELKLERITPGKAARALQNFTVQIPPEARRTLCRNGHVEFIEKFGDQFAVLRSSRLYKRERDGEDVGLLWEQGDELDQSIV